MTREQALGHEGDLVMECEDTPGINGLINVIYDSFEQQTCDNCSVMNCIVLLSIYHAKAEPNFDLYTFGCNQFKLKVNH